MSSSHNYDEEVWQWVLTSLGPEGRAKLYGECVAANLIRPRRWWVVESLSDLSNWNRSKGKGDRRQMVVLGAPKRRLSDGRR